MDAITFWNRVAAYNQATWPVQAVMMLVVVYLTYRIVAKPGTATDTWMKAFLALAFAWNGIVFFLVFMRNPISVFTGTPLFVAVSVLFAVDIFGVDVCGARTHFRLPERGWARGFTIAGILLVLLYPLVGWPLGHIYPRVLLPLFPCPLTVFAITLVAAAAPHADRTVFIALLPWALLGLPKCLGALNCTEDCILVAAGVYGLIVLIRSWRSLPRRGRRAGQGSE